MTAIGDKWVSDCGSVELHCGDALTVLPTLFIHDALVTDPPYGIGEARKDNASRSCLAESRDYGCESWDDKPISADLLNACCNRAKWSIIFGGNYYQLPPASCWLIWDKQNGNNDFADCEMAWTNMPKAIRRIVHQWHGMIRKGNERRFHPTQKPLAVMEWCIERLPHDVDTILDPFAGSGTTLVAAVRQGKRATGIELSPAYFDIAVRRIKAELNARKNALFDPVEYRVTQKEMFAEATA